MNEFLENLKRQAEANPLLALGIATGLIAAVSKLMDSKSGMKNAASWDRETRRRNMKFQK